MGNRLLPGAFFSLPFVAVGLASATSAAATCESLTSLKLDEAVVTGAQSIPAGSFAPATGPAFTNLPAFCRVTAALKPSPDSDIKIEVWLPTSGWNGKFEGTGNGGYAGSIVYRTLAQGLQAGYAIANTDLGTSPARGQDADPLIGHPEKWIDFGWRATHAMTVASKRVVAAFYERAPQHSYFWGCSTGGQEAFSEAQRFPDDYDGIAAGASGYDRTHLHTSFVWAYDVTHKTPDSALPIEKLTLLHKSMVAACHASTGAGAADDFINDPLACDFSPKALQCTGADNANCLTPAQVEAAEAIYDGPRNPRNHHLIAPGFAKGSELTPAWTALEGAATKGREPAYGLGLFKTVFGANWDSKTFDFDKDMVTVDQKLAPDLNAWSTDLTKFKAHGGKMIMYHGWSDATVPGRDSINYYNLVSAREGAATQKFLRLFMVPGMGHCNGGPGPNSFDSVAALAAWVEQGTAPAEIVATKFVDDRRDQKVAMTRPLCPYPQVAKYKGSGDPTDAANFSCAAGAGRKPELPASEYRH